MTENGGYEGKQEEKDENSDIEHASSQDNIS